MTQATGNIVPPDVVCADDYERHAHARLPAPILAYIAGAGADGITRRWNRAAFDEMALAGRVLADMSKATTEGTLLGLPLAHPVILAPVAHQMLVHPEGERAMAIGASATQSWMTVSTLSSIRLEDVAAASQTTLMFQLYFQMERAATLGLVRRAEAAGYKALMVTVDAPINGVRNDEQRAGFGLPAHVRPVNIEGLPGPVSRAGPGESPVFKGLLDRAPTWTDVEWLRANTALPILLKGIVHPDDAARAISLGVDGIVVSNHGGRTLDTLPSSVAALERVAARVRGRVPLLVDGGIRRGTDVLKALALGADAVMVGRAAIYALAVSGAVGIAHLTTILRAELEVAMALTGCATRSDIGPDVLWSRDRRLLDEADGVDASIGEAAQRSLSR